MKSIRYLLLPLLLALSAPRLPAQESLTLFDIDPSGFPTVSGRFFALDADGAPIRTLGPADVTIIENGTTRSVTAVDCSGGTDGSPISAVLAFDVSKSMARGGPKIDIAQAAGAAWVRALPSDGSECAITSFDERGSILQDFTTDRAKLNAAVSALTPHGGTSHVAALSTPPAGAIPMAARGRHRRVVVLLTDGDGGGPAGPITQLAADNSVTIYCISLGMEAPDMLREIAEKSGGRWFENIATQQEAEAIYTIILQEALGRLPCRVEWRSDWECDRERRVAMRIDPRGPGTGIDYTAPPSSVPRLEISPSQLSFGPVDPPGYRDLTITVTARGRAVVVNGVTEGNPLFTLVDGTGSFALLPDESRTIVIRYTPSDIGYEFARILFDADACADTSLYVSGGRVGEGPQRKSLRVISPNGGEMIPAGADTVIRWDGLLPAETVRLEYSLNAGGNWTTITDTARGLAYPWKAPPTPSGSCLIRIFQLSGRTPDDPLTLAGEHTKQVRSAAFSPDGRRVVTGGDDRKGVIWDALTGAVIGSLTGHGDWIYCADYSPDGRRIATASFDHQAIVWDAATFAPIFRLTGHFNNVASAHFSHDGAYLVTSGKDGRAFVWDMTDGSETARLTGHREWVFSARFSEDDRYIVTAGSDSIALVWDVSTWKSILTIRHNDQINDARFSPDGTRIVTAGDDGRAKIWDARNGTLLRTINVTNNRVYSALFSPDERFVVTGSDDGVGRIWDAQNGTLLRQLVGHTNGILSANISSNGRLVVTGSRDQTARVWGTDIFTAQGDVSDNLWAIVAPAGSGDLIDFGDIPVGTPKDSIVTALVRNDGSAPLRITGIAINGANPSDFSVVSGGPPFTLPVGGAATVELRFHPSAPGLRTAKLLSSTTGETTIEQELTGNGVIPAIGTTPAIDFGEVRVGGTGDTLVDAFLGNTGTTTINLQGAIVTGPPVNPFTIVSGGGAGPLAPGEARAVRVRFSPGDVGRVSGRIEFPHDGVGGPAVVELFGEGIEPTLAGPAEIRMTEMICGSRYDTLLVLRNDGRSRLTIDSAGIGGTDGGEFVLLDKSGAPLTLPLRIEYGESDTIIVRAAPGKTGNLSASIVLRSNAVNIAGKYLEIPLTLSRSLVAFRMITPSLDFFGLDPNTPAVRAGRLVNTGTLPLTWSVPVTVGAFTIESIVPLTTPPGGESEITVRYAGGPEGAGAEEEYTFVDPICGETGTLSLRALVENGGVLTLAVVDTLRGAPGERVEVAVRLRDLRRLHPATTGFRGRLRFDAGLLYPIEGTPAGNVVGSERVIDVDLPLPSPIGPDSVIARLPFLATLGAVRTTPLVLEDPVAIGGKANIGTVPGVFALEGLCETGTTRILRSGDFVLKPARPNPSSDVAALEYSLVEDGPVRLLLTDALGAVVAVIVDEELRAGGYISTIDLSALPGGLYFYRLETRTQSAIGTLTVSR